LASVSTRAVLDGDQYVVNGSKIWTSRAEVADHIFLLVRTNPDAKKQLGITFLLMDMNQPGVEVKPLLAFNGVRLWNQVFFEDALVPKENCLGGENQGWSVAKSLLGDERLLVSRVGENQRICRRLLELLAEPPITLAGDEAWTNRLAETRIRLEALEASALRLLTKFDQGGVIGAEPSMLKLQGSQLVQAFDTLLMELIGDYALPENRFQREEDATPICHESIDMIASGRYHHRGFTLAGGTSEIQHDIIAKSVLGL
jgi:acyl-CoA dehydrogenase